MKKNIIILLISALTALLCIGSAAAVEPAKLTVMLYLCGTDLETDGAMASYNLNEIGQTTANSDVNLVIETGGTLEWHGEEEDYPYVNVHIAAGINQYWQYGENGFTLVQDLDKAYDMTDSATLSAFINWSAANYPAEKYVLILWDHGGGTNGGLFVDQNFPESASMSVPEVGTALNDGGVHFDTVIIDACMMSSLGTAMAVQPYADYLVASEELAPGNGSAFKEWVQYFYDRPDYEAPHFGRYFCDTMQQKYNELGLTETMDTATFAMIDLSKVPAVADAARAYLKEVTGLLSNVNNFSDFAYFVKYVESYGFTDCDMHDLGDLAYKSKGSGISNEAIYNLTDAITDAVISSTKGVGRSYGHGLSFFYMPNATNEYLDLYAANCTIPEYVAFLDAINPDWTAPASVYEKTERLPEVDPSQYTIEYELEPVDDGSHLALHITSGQAAVLSVDFSILGLDEEDLTAYVLGTGYNVDGDFETGEFVERFDGSWPALAGIFLDMEIAEEKETSTIYNVPVVLYYSEDGEYYKPAEESIAANVFRGVTTDEYEDDDLVFDYDYEEEVVLRVGNNHDVDEMIAMGYDEEYASQGYGTFELYGVWDGYDSNTGIRNRNVSSMDSLAGMYLSVKQPVIDLEEGEYLGNYVSDPIYIDEDLNVEEYYLTDGTYLFTYLIDDVFGNEIVTDYALMTIEDGEAYFSLLDE